MSKKRPIVEICSWTKNKNNLLNEIVIGTFQLPKSKSGLKFQDGYVTDLETCEVIKLGV